MKKKRGFTLIEMMAVVIIIAIIAVLAVPPILQSIRGAKDSISDAMKKVIVSASDLYMDDNKDNYARYNGNRYCITLRQLVESEKLTSPIYDPTTSQEISQDKFVKVDIFDNEYSYEIVDSCEEIRRNSLAYILKQDCKAENTVGLIKDADGTCYYKGTNEEVSNNFVWFGGHLWRVISIDNDDNLTMITQQPITAINLANRAWKNEDEYKNSYVNQWLNEEFLGSMNDVDKNKIQSSIFNIGGIYNSSTDKVENIDGITTTQLVGLLDEEQYIRAGSWNSFLDINDNWRLGSKYDDTSFRLVGYNKNFYNISVQAFGIRPVIQISNFIFTEGDGTLSNPYREKSISTSTANIKVGEYISVPTSGTDCGTNNRCLFRVVSKDNDSIKVTLNGLLPNESAFDLNGNNSYTSGNTIDIVLTDFSNTIDSKYRYTENKIFNIWSVLINSSYNDAAGKTYEGNVGLPVIGEMFSCNDIDITSSTESKTFVNVSTIENANTGISSVWMMNEMQYDNTKYVWYFADDGSIWFPHIPSFKSGVRPVLFLKNNLKFTSGEGTAENPFVLE